MANGNWIKNEESFCPKCNKPVEELIVTDYDEYNEQQEYVNAERCPRCRWIADFEADPIETKRY